MEERPVRTTLALDDDLLNEAQHLTGTTEKTAVVREALRALIERESARRLARLAGAEPSLADVRRRRAQTRRSWSTPRSGSIICAPGTPRWLVF